jgi:tetratricopeptide (TPR) repeat protein
LARRSIEDIDAAASAVRHAISIDPGFSAAWSTLAEIRVFQAMRSLRPPREVGWLANEAVQSALEIDPKSASALSIRGWIRSMIEQDYDRGLEDLDLAYKYDPDYWGVNLLRGWILQATKRHQDAVVMMRRAIELNPVGHSVNSILAMYLLFSGEIDESLSVSRELARRFPTIDNAQSIACIVTSVHGLHEESIAFGRKAMRLAPHTPIIHAPLAYALAHAGRHDEARGILNTMEMSNLPKPSAALAPVYLALGEKETAIELIKDAHERGVPQFAWTRDDPRLSSLKGEPSVERLWARIGLSANFSPSQTFPAPLVDGFLNVQGR